MLNYRENTFFSTRSKVRAAMGFCADYGYKGTFEEQLWDRFLQDIKKTDKWDFLPKRWNVERTFAWLNNYRGLSKDYKIAQIYTLLKPL